MTLLEKKKQKQIVIDILKQIVERGSQYPRNQKIWGIKVIDTEMGISRIWQNVAHNEHNCRNHLALFKVN